MTHRLRETINTRPLGMFSLLLLMIGAFGFVFPVHAKERIPNRTQQHLVMDCMPTTGGLVVRYSQASPSTTLVPPTAGEPCLPYLAHLPLRVRSSLPVLFPSAAPSARGGGSGVAHHLLWFLKGPRLSPVVVGCAVGADDILRTMFVDSEDARVRAVPQVGDSCLSSILALETLGYQDKGPIGTTLGQAADGQHHGGLLWVKHRRKTVEVLTCNLDANGQLVSTYRESSQDGVMAHGASCLSVLAKQGREHSLKVRGPLPIPADGDDIDVPDCLIWDIDIAT